MKIFSLSKLIVVIILLTFQYSFAAESRLVKVGSDDHFPVIFQDKGGVAQGLYVDLLTEIGRKENIRFEYVFGTWENALNMIKSGEIDLLPGVGYTAERAQFMDYCKIPLLTVWGELYALQSSEIKSILDISGKKIGVIKGDINAKNFLELTSKFHINCEFVELAGYEDVFKAVKTKVADAGVVGVTFGASKHGEYGLRSTGVIFNPYDLYISTTKGKNQDLILIVNKYLSEWKNQDTSIFNNSKLKWIYGSVGTVAVVPDWLIKVFTLFGVMIAVALAFIILLNLRIKRATKQLQKSEANYRQLFDNSPTAIYQINFKTGKFIKANDILCEYIGCRQEEVTSLSPYDSLTNDSKKLFSERLEKMILGKKVTENPEYEVVDKNGKRRWLQLNSKNIYDSEGLAGADVVAHDITDRKRAEEAQRESEEKYRTLMEKVNEGILIAQDSNIAYANDKVGGILAIPVEELIGKAFVDFIHPEDKNLVFERYKKRLAGENISDAYEFRVINRMGETRWLHLSARQIQWNKKPATINMLMDITERKLAEEKLRESQELEELILSSVPHGLFGVENRQIFFANDAIKNVTGWEPSELIGKSSRILFSNDQEWKEYGAMLYGMLENEAAISFEFPRPFIRKDGREIYCRTSASRIGGDLTAGNLIVAMIEDITERKRSEEALQESSARLTRAEKTAKMGNWKLMLNTKEFIGSLGAQTIYGAEGDVLSFDDARKCTLPEYIDILNKGLTDLITKDIPYNLDIKIRRPTDGKIIDVHSIAEYDKENNIVYGVIQDITEQKQAEEEKRDLQERLNRAEKMEALGTLAGGVAHDLNNVLGIIVGYSEMILDEVDEKSSLKRPLVNIFNSGQKAAAIVDDLLTLARRGVPGSSILNLNKIIKDSQQSPELSKLLSHHASVKIKTDLDSDLLNISGSSVHLNKSLYNLISNACEAMNKGGILTIKTTNQYLDKPMSGYNEIREGDYVVISVSDTGEGISEKDMKRIFEPFYTKKIMGRSGTGLGLAVVWGTVTDHNGYINVHSEEGKGSTFTLYFPVTREEIPDEAMAIDVSAYMGNGQSILIVDDVSIQRELATDMLKKLNYNVDSVQSGEEAIIYLKDHQADLIVLDMIMDPGMDGLDTYKSIIKMNPKQKTIIVSGFSESDRVKEAKRLGVGTYVRKPYIKERLGLAVKKELG